MRLGAFLLVAALVSLPVPAALAGSPRAWRLSGVDGWKGTERQSVGITSDGAIALSRDATAVPGLAAFVVWDLLRDGGATLVATGDEGVLYRVDGEGEAREVTRVVQPEITALGRDGRNRVLLGTSPDGMLYRLEGDRAVSVTDTPEEYIWAILPAGEDEVVLATGNSGKIYRLKGETLTVLTDPGVVHVTGLFPREDGWLATTDSPGRLLRIARTGAIEVLHDAEEGELRAPVAADDGSVYFLANPERGAGRVYRRSLSGAVEPVWESLDGYLYALRLDDAGFLWVSTGSDTGAATVVRLEPGPPTTWHEAVRLEDLQAPCFLLEKGAPAIVGTSNRGRVHRVAGGGASEGTVTSPVHDAGSASRWGALSLEPRMAAPSVLVETRSGNTRAPDTTWTSWTRVPLEGHTGPVKSLGGRFLQWRLRVTDAETRVGAVAVAYLPANLAPRVNEVAVTELGKDFSLSWDRGQPQSLGQDLPGGVHVEFQVPPARGGPPSAAPDDAAGWARRYRTVTWKAADPNDDDLRYAVAVRAQGETRWNPVEEDLESSPWVWDSATVPDGWYQVRITASDGPSNPPDDAQMSARATEPFLVDNTAPRVLDLTVRGGRVTGRAADEASPIKNLEQSVDGGAWTRLFPEDGIADQTEERFEAPAGKDLEPGDHVLVVRVFDQAGNVGTARATFTTP
jgi:hypothetical protein